MTELAFRADDNGHYDFVVKRVYAIIMLGFRCRWTGARVVQGLFGFLV